MGLLLFTRSLLFGQNVLAHWPDHTKVDKWFSDTTKVALGSLGRQYVVTDFGVVQDSTMVQTTALQKVIDRAHDDGGGVIVIPKGTFLSGSLFFKQGTHLYLSEGSRLKGADRIEHFPVLQTRIEGQTCRYFAALVNAEGLDGFTISGPGTIDGNGYHYWKEFWIRRQWNPECTNKDAQRPRLVYLSCCKNVTVADVHMENSPFWTNHLYRCDHVRYLGVSIYAPTEGVKAPSSDAIDLDACSDVLIHGCYMNVNDDAIALKGGKGEWADTLSENGPNERILVDRCTFATVHACLTVGSESVYDRNVVMQNCLSTNANRVLWLKMRPDTPQHYEFVSVCGMKGYADKFLVIRPWTQFYAPEDRPDKPRSRCNDISIEQVEMSCNRFFDVAPSADYQLDKFSFQGINVKETVNSFNIQLLPKAQISDVVINGKRY